jgi:hypothetical protein
MVQPQLGLSAGRPSTLDSLRIKMRLGSGSVAHAVGFYLRAAARGIPPAAEDSVPSTRTENAEPRLQPPSDASLVQPEPCFGEGKQKGLYFVAPFSWGKRI